MKDIKVKKVFLPIQLTEKDRHIFKVACVKKGLSMGYVLRQAIQKFVDGEDTEVTKQARADA